MAGEGNVKMKLVEAVKKKSEKSLGHVSTLKRYRLYTS